MASVAKRCQQKIKCEGGSAKGKGRGGFSKGDEMKWQRRYKIILQFSELRLKKPWHDQSARPWRDHPQTKSQVEIR